MLTVPEVRYKTGAYILHFLQPLGDPTRPRASARHYIGSAKSVGFRLQQHEQSQGKARIVHVCNERGILWCVAHIQYTDTIAEAVALERKWKRAGHQERRCPFCQEARAQSAGAVQLNLL